MPKKPAQTQDKYVLRLPDGMRERIKLAAEQSGRSMNAEIVVRLGQSLDGYFIDLSPEGLIALVKRLEASVEVADHLVFGIRDRLPALETFSSEKGVSRQEAIHLILEDWLASHGYTDPLLPNTSGA